MKILKTIKLLALTGLMAGLTACMGTSSANATGGELTGVRGTSYQEPTPYGMVAVSKGSLRVGLAENDTLWGLAFPARDITFTVMQRPMPATSAWTVFGWTSMR